VPPQGGDVLLQTLIAPQSLFKYQSGRVIALGRVILATLFMLAVWLDPSEPVSAVAGTYSLLALYALSAIAIAAVTWRNWWLDARLAVPTHAADMAVFTAIVFSSNGTTSPFFLFFVLPLLSAAIRWSWRETALTATVLVLLYMMAGLLIAGTGTFELERFIIRAGNLLILSLLLIWFGIHQIRTNLFFRTEEFETGLGVRDNPLARAVGLATQITGASAGALVVGAIGEEPCDGFSVIGEKHRSFSVDRALVRDTAPAAFLYDVGRDRAVTRPPQGRFHFASAYDLLDFDEAHRLGLGIGLASEVKTSTQHGWLLLWDIPELSTDFIDLARELGRAASFVLDRHALFAAIENGAAARTRLSLARDVHDSIVQFLAGAAFRIEALKRSAGSGNAINAELDELKRLLLEEQGEIRGFVLALRRDRDIDLTEAVAELRALAERLSQQWSVDCRITANGARASIPIRLQLDLQQLLREAVANAVRHGGADRIDVALGVDGDRLQLNVADNGSGFAKGKGQRVTEPWSLKERVERANGSMRLVSSPGSTNITISLPLAGAAA
jgi:signal transduction histidine kinase